MHPFGKGWKSYIPYICMAPTIFLFLALSVGPSLVTAILSFTDISGIPGLPWKFIGIDNYKEFLFGPSMEITKKALFKQIQFSFYVVLIQNVLSLLVAMILNTKIHGRIFYRAVIFLPAVLGVTVTGIIWTMVLNPVDGPVQQFIGLFGLNSAFFGDIAISFKLVIFIQIWMSAGYSVVIYLAGLQSISPEMYEACYIDGATPVQSFRFVTFPLLASTVTTNVLLAIIGSLQDFSVVYITTNGQYETLTLGMLIFQTAFTGGVNGQGGLPARQGFGAAMYMIQFAIVLTVTLITQYYLRRREVDL